MNRVLVIDGDPVAARGLQRLLGTDGYDAASENDPGQALARFARESFDVVVTDLEVPRVRGVDVIRTVRAVRPGTTVVAITTGSDRRACDEALAAGASRVFEKPLDYDKLSEELRRRVRERREGCR